VRHCQFFRVELATLLATGDEVDVGFILAKGDRV